MESSPSNEPRVIELPEDLTGWLGFEPEIIDGQEVQVILQLVQRGQLVADVGGRGVDRDAAVAMAIKHARQWAEERQ